MNRKQDEWMLHVRVGDVLRARSGLLRIVRQVSRFADGELRAVAFAIKRCSWTKRPYTTVNFTDLRCGGYARVGANVRIDSEKDGLLRQAIEKHADRALMSCCEALDMP